jgi:hypothetical protein
MHTLRRKGKVKWSMTRRRISYISHKRMGAGTGRDRQTSANQTSAKMYMVVMMKMRKR